LKPSIGRIVHFYPPVDERENAEFYAAIITAVADDETVSVCTMGPRSLYFHEGVHLMGTRDRDGLERKSGWAWPPRVG
jgi:hypothetical protein